MALNADGLTILASLGLAVASAGRRRVASAAAPCAARAPPCMQPAADCAKPPPPRRPRKAALVLGAYVLASCLALARKIDTLLDDKGVRGRALKRDAAMAGGAPGACSRTGCTRTLTHAQVVRMPWVPLAEIMSACGVDNQTKSEADLKQELEKARLSLERQVREAQLTFDVTVESLTSRVAALESAGRGGAALAPDAAPRATKSPRIGKGSVDATEGNGAVPREEPPPLLPHVASAPVYADSPALEKGAGRITEEQAGNWGSVHSASSEANSANASVKEPRTLGGMKPLPPPDRRNLPAGAQMRLVILMLIPTKARMQRHVGSSSTMTVSVHVLRAGTGAACRRRVAHR